MNKSRLLKDVLKFRYRHSKVATFLLRSEDLVPVAQSVLSVMNKSEESSLPDDFQLLKGAKGDRVVFRVKPSQFNKDSFVVKVCPVFRFKHRLAYLLMKTCTLGFSEAANLIIAASRGLNVPKVYGYGSIYDSCRLTKMTVVILEDLSGYISVDELLKLNRGDEQKCAEILSRTIPVFVDLYNAKCNNIEINLHAVMLGDKGSNPDTFVLDFENAKFHNNRSSEILIFEAASFVKWTPYLLTKQLIDDWLAKLLDAIKVEDNTTRKKMTERFNYYCITKLHRKHRRKIYGDIV